MPVVALGADYDPAATPGLQPRRLIPVLSQTTVTVDVVAEAADRNPWRYTGGGE